MPFTLPVRYIKNENNDIYSSLLSLIKKVVGDFYWVTSKQLLKGASGMTCYRHPFLMNKIVKFYNMKGAIDHKISGI